MIRRTALLFLFYILTASFTYKTTDACVSFICINSCGGDPATKSGYKLILANNRDEDIYRATLSASVWPSKSLESKKSTNSIQRDADFISCDQSDAKSPYNLCVYGALDVAKGTPPQRFSTWLGSLIFLNLLEYTKT
jgi:hypothetical protein